MARTEAPTPEAETRISTGRGPLVAVGCGVLGCLTAVWTFWMIVPGIAFGAAAVVLGIRARKRGAGEAGSVAVALGVVALLLVPSVLVIVSAAEDWGRDCALDPSNPDC